VNLDNVRPDSFLELAFERGFDHEGQSESVDCLVDPVAWQRDRLGVGDTEVLGDAVEG